MKPEEIKEGNILDDKIKAITGGCTCDKMYSSRQLIAPDCVYHNFGDDIGELIAENDRLRKALEEILTEIKKGDWNTPISKLLIIVNSALNQQP